MLLGWLPVVFPIALDLFVLYFLFRGPRRSFPFVIVFCVIQILVTCANVGSFLLAGTAQNRHLYLEIFWTGDLIAHAAISLLIVSLIWQTLEANQARKVTVALIAAGLLGFAIASAYVFHAPQLSRWMTPLSRNLSFCEEILNLILWSILLKSKASNYLLLMVSAGIGVQVTGEVIGHTLRLYTGPSTVWVPNTLVYISEIVCLCIWIWAFRAAATAKSLNRLRHDTF